MLLFAEAVRQTPCPRTTCPWLGTVPVLTGIREKKETLIDSDTRFRMDRHDTRKFKSVGQQRAEE